MIALNKLKRRVIFVRLAVLFNAVIIALAAYYILEAYNGNAPAFMHRKDAALQFSGLLAVCTLAIIFSYFSWQKEMLHVAAQLHPEAFDPTQFKKRWWTSKRMRGFKQLRLFWRLLHDIEALPWWKNPITFMQLGLVLMFILHRVAMRYLLMGDSNMMHKNVEIAALIDLGILSIIAMLALATVHIVTRIVIIEQEFEEQAIISRSQETRP